MVSLSMEIFPCITRIQRENNLIVDSILFFYASTIKNVFIAKNRQKRIYFKKVSKNVFFKHFAKAIAGKMVHGLGIYY